VNNSPNIKQNNFTQSFQKQKRMESTKLKHAERLKSQTDAEGIVTNSSDSQPVFTQRGIPGTPFTLVLFTEEQEFLILWGKYRITENRQIGQYQDAVYWLQDNQYNVMVMIATIVVEYKIAEGLANTHKFMQEEVNKNNNNQNQQQ
jgi:hypothetical protein